jgi:hypothetical protein
LKLTRCKIADLKPHPKNYNTHSEEQIEELCKSLKKFKQFKNVIVCKGKILAGHGLIEAAKRLEMKEIDAQVLDNLSEKEQMEIIIADNVLPTHAVPDYKKLNSLLSEIGDDETPGVTEEWLKRMKPYFDQEKDELPNSDAEPQIDKAEELRIEWGVETGQLWELGDHRLLCGDSTKPENAERLLMRERSSLLFTSPPYLAARDYGGNDLDLGEITRFIVVFKGYTDLQAINLGIIRKDNEVVLYWNAYIEKAVACGLNLLSWNIWDRQQPWSMAQNTAMFPIEHEWIFIFGLKIKPPE